MTQILLVNPPLHDTRIYGRDFDGIWSPPLGIAYISAVLEQSNFDVRALDLYYVSWGEAEKIIAREKPVIVGISCFSEQRASAFKLARLIKSLSPSVLVVLGGPHATFMYKQILEHLPVDVVVLGEGERSFLELVRSYFGSGDLSVIPGLAFKQSGEVVRTAKRSVIKELDSIPFPSYHFFGGSKYASRWWVKGLSALGRDAEELKFISIIASRGCPFKCSFCTTPEFWGRRWRCRSQKNVVDEMEMLKDKFGYEYFNIADDIFAANQHWVDTICQEIIDRHLDVVWDCETRVDCISKDLLKRMREAGCLFVSFGVESFSSNVLEAIDKGITIDQIVQAFDWAHQTGLKTEIFLMVGNPGESEQTIRTTMDIVQRINPHIVSTSISTVLPGTGLYRQALANGLLDEDYWLTDKPAPYYTVEHDESTLKRWCEEINTCNGQRFVSKDTARFDPSCPT